MRFFRARSRSDYDFWQEMNSRNEFGEIVARRGGRSLLWNDNGKERERQGGKENKSNNGVQSYSPLSTRRVVKDTGVTTRAGIQLADWKTSFSAPFVLLAPRLPCPVPLVRPALFYVRCFHPRAIYEPSERHSSSVPCQFYTKITRGTALLYILNGIPRRDSFPPFHRTPLGHVEKERPLGSLVFRSVALAVSS